MADERAEVRLDKLSNPSALAGYTEALLAQATAENIPSGILHWSYVHPYRIAEFDGLASRGVCDQPTWMQLYSELHAGQKRDVGVRGTDDIRSVIAAYHARGIVPIAIAHYDYHTPKRTFVARAISAAEKNEVLPSASELGAERILEARRAFFASALLPDRSHGFEFLPHVHDGLAPTFVLARELFLTNRGDAPANIEIDFDDGHGYRPATFDEPVTITYGEDFPKQIRVRTTVAGEVLEASFRFRARALTAPNPDQTWRLTGVESYAGQLATGTAWVFYGAGHTTIVDPIIVADGFGAGATSLTDTWSRLDEQSLATSLLQRGKDVIILGYDSKSQYIQANALLAVACIEKTIASRSGSLPLNVGGASMGGLVTRYALAWMEAKHRPHQATKYLSFDSPHYGAWVPLILQYFAYYFENQSDSAKQLANLVRSAAAQELLWGWVPSWDYSGAVTQNPLRAAMYDELRSYGWFASMPRKYGVSNGTGTGTGNGVPSGANAFDWSGNACVGARPNIEPDRGNDQYLGDMWLGWYWNKYYATNVPAFDSAPGGTADFFGQAGDGAAGSGYGSTTIHYRTTDFIPSVSALAINRMYDPFVNISQLPPGSSELDEFIYCASNLPHVTVTPEIAQWVLARFAAPVAEERQREPRRVAEARV